MAHKYTSLEIANVKNWIVSSLQILVQKDGDLLRPEAIPTLYRLKGQKDLNRQLHETAINHRLAFHLEYLIEKHCICGYHVDIEYNRYINNKKLVQSMETRNLIEVRPDIIVHKRTRLRERDPHFLVVEAKKRKVNDKDRNHVEDIMCDNNYRYKFGMLISYYDNPQVIQVTFLTRPNDEFSEDIFTVSKMQTTRRN
jgi:hypothetical protein